MILMKNAQETEESSSSEAVEGWKTVDNQPDVVHPMVIFLGKKWRVFQAFHVFQIYLFVSISTAWLVRDKLMTLCWMFTSDLLSIFLF